MTVNFHLTKDEVIKIFGSEENFVKTAIKANEATTEWSYGSIEVEVEPSDENSIRSMVLGFSIPTYVQISEDYTDISESGDIVIEANFREENHTLSNDPTDVNNPESVASLMMRYLKDLIGE